MSAHSVVPWIDPTSHGDVLHPRTDADWDELVQVYAGPDTPFANVIAVSVSRLCLDCEAHRRAPRAWRPCERHQQPNLSAAADTIHGESR